MMKPTRQANLHSWDVTNLKTGTTWIYGSDLLPEEAVRNGHAQSNGDFNTWDYATKYPMDALRIGKVSISMGDCAVLVSKQELDRLRKLYPTAKERDLAQ